MTETDKALRLLSLDQRDLADTFKFIQSKHGPKDRPRSSLEHAQHAMRRDSHMFSDTGSTSTDSLSSLHISGEKVGSPAGNLYQSMPEALTALV